MTLGEPSRHLALDGTRNVRDVGGYPAANGRRTRWRTLLRSDELTTLPETDDRILATSVSARWSYAEGGIDYTAAWHDARDAILESFGDHFSPSAQFTLRRMGRAVLKAVEAIERVHLSLPNRHHLLYDLSGFDMENPNAVFHATTEPYGLIEGTVERG